MAKILVRHHRKKSPTVVSDAFANRSRKLIVGPRTCPSFHIRSEVRSDNVPRKVRHIQPLPAAFRARNHRRPMRTPVMLRMAFPASGQSNREISPALQPLRSHFKFPRGQRPSLRTNKRPPANSQADGGDKENREHNPCKEKYSPEPFHCTPPREIDLSLVSSRMKLKVIFGTQAKRQSVRLCRTTPPIEVPSPTQSKSAPYRFFFPFVFLVLLAAFLAGF